MKNFVLFLILCFFFAQCTREKLPVYYLAESKQIDVIADTLLFVDINCLTFHDEELYFTNPVTDQIVSLDRNFNLKKILGKKGQGPNELLNIGQFAICDSLISVLNGSNGRINIFSTEGNIISEVSISKSILLFDSNYRYCFTGNDIIGSSSIADAPLSKYNIYTKEQTLFGKTHVFPTPKQTSIRNNRFTAKMDNRLIVVSDNLPFIEIYDSDNLEQSVQYDYSDIAQVRSSIQAIENKRDQTDNSYRRLCEDIYVANQHLYLLLIDYSNDDFNVNQIINFDIYPDIKPVCIYKLQGKYFTTFCISEEDGAIYAYHHTDNTLRVYLINQ